MQKIRQRLENNKGFSLIELIVVIAIMVILIALLVPNVVGYINSARGSADKAVAKSLFTASTTSLSDALTNNVDIADYVDNTKPDYMFGAASAYDIRALVSGNITWTDVTVYVDTTNRAITGVRYHTGADAVFYPENNPAGTPFDDTASPAVLPGGTPVTGS